MPYRSAFGLLVGVLAVLLSALLEPLGLTGVGVVSLCSRRHNDPGDYVSVVRDLPGLFGECVVDPCPHVRVVEPGIVPSRDVHIDRSIRAVSLDRDQSYRPHRPVRASGQLTRGRDRSPDRGIPVRCVTPGPLPHSRAVIGVLRAYAPPPHRHRMTLPLSGELRRRSVYCCSAT